MVELFEEGQPITDPHIDDYGDPGIRSGHAPIARWLKVTYVILPIWGLISGYIFWNGSTGWLDRGSWQLLEQAARTTFPMEQSGAAAGLSENNK
jgi:hypothetical protein